MTLGEGIFYGALVLGIVALYLGTKDRWRWKKIVGRTLLGTFAFGLVVAASVWAYNWYEARPRVMTELWGIKLGASRSDVLVTKGEPSSPAAAGRDTNDLWTYKAEGYRVDVGFLNGRVDSIYSYGGRLNMPMPPTISGYTDSEELIGRFGPPSSINDTDGGPYRTFNFKKFNLLAVYSKGELVAVGVDARIPEKGRTFAKDSN